MHSEALSVASLDRVLAKLRMYSDTEPLSLSPSKIMIPCDIVVWLADMGYDSQEKIDELVGKLLNNSA